MVDQETKKVSLFREILIWPLLIKDANKEEPSKRLKLWADKLEGTNWIEIDNLFRLSADWDETCYAECVYFHPFVQRFLYNKDKQILRIFNRGDISKVSIEIKYNDPDKEDIDEKFNVDRIHLYLFDVGVALFVVEISAQKNIPLRKTQEILDRFRRAYSPYWDNDRPGHCPTKVQWFSNDKEIPPSDYDNKQAIKDVKEKLAPPMAAHWVNLIKPFIPWQGDNNNSSELQLKQIGDERIPVMAYLAFDDPAELKDGDFMRLGLLDEEGPSDKFPYGTDFMADFKGKYCYDRYWDPPNWLTRYICCGYAFIVIGKDDGKEKNPFFTNENTGLLAHFRHHYLQMGIMVHFYHASLLMFFDRFSQAVADWDKEKELNIFRKQVESIQRDILRFTQRYWFIDISNQAQAREMFDLWKKHLGVEKWFEQVKEEARNINDYLNAEQQEKLTQTAVRLTVVATIGLILSLTINGLAVTSWTRFRWLLTVISIIILLLVWLSGKIGRFFDWLIECKGWKSLCFLIFIVILFLMIW